MADSQNKIYLPDGNYRGLWFNYFVIVRLNYHDSYKFKVSKPSSTRQWVSININSFKAIIENGPE